MQLSINDVTVAKIITTLWEGIVVFVVSNLKFVMALDDEYEIL